VKPGPFSGIQYTLLGNFEPGRLISRGQLQFQEVAGKRVESKTLDLGTVALTVECNYDFEQGIAGADLAEAAEHGTLAGCYGPEQTPPGEMHMYFIGYTLEFGGQILHGGLNEQDIGKAAFFRTPVDLLGYLGQGPRTGIDPDVELVRVLSSALVYKATVAGPDIDHNPPAGTGQ